MMTAKKERHWNLPMIHMILALAWPTMLEQLMQTAVQYIDTAMVGTLGTHATAAATTGWTHHTSTPASSPQNRENSGHTRPCQLPGSPE